MKNTFLPAYYFVFDVESVGLHGEGFMAGYVVVTPGGTEVAAGLFACHPDRASGTDGGRAWVAEHVPAPPPWFRAGVGPAAARDEFWEAWTYWRGKGAVLAADCAWPVEARFLNACVDQAPGVREWGGPYPLVDVASVRLGAGLDPTAVCDRMDDERPAHNPLADARQSARLLVEALATPPGN